MSEEENRRQPGGPVEAPGTVPGDDRPFDFGPWLEVPIPAVLRRAQIPSIRFRVAGFEEPLAASPELAAACHLIPAMALGLPLQLDATPDPVLRAALPALMERYAAWNPGLRAVAVEAPAGGEPAAAAPGRATAAFFSGGADSFYTLVARRDEIDALVYVLGYDIRPEQETLWRQTRAMLRAVAEAFGKRLIVVETNLRAWLDQSLGWGMTHGAALAAVAHLLAPAIGRAIIPSSYTRAQLHPWGTHPDLDPRWSGARVAIEHDAVTATRADKIRRLAGDATAMRWLRVCWRNPEEAYNCGRCPKCLRTMLALDLAGAADRCATLPAAIDPDAVRAIDLGGPAERFFAEELAAAYAAAGRAGEPQAAALGSALARQPVPEPPPRVETAVELVVGPPGQSVENGRTVLTAPVRFGAVTSEVRVALDLDGRPAPRPGDALLVWFTAAAMRLGAPLRVEAEVSPELAGRMGRVQDVLVTLPVFNGLRRVPFRLTPAAGPIEGLGAGRRCAAAFSGGVDAFYTLLTNRDRVDRLLYIHGLDAIAPAPRHLAADRKRLAAAAADLGLRLIEVETNLRKVIVGDLGGAWYETFMMATFGMAHLMAGSIAALLVAGEVSYREMQQVVETSEYHPLLAHRLGSNAVAIEVDGMDKRRHEKAAYLAGFPELVGPHLKVCYAHLVEGYEGARNCGRCEKCLRTMAEFRLAGKLDAVRAAFDVPLDLRRLAAARIYEGTLKEVRMLFYIGMAEELARTGRDPALLEAVEAVIAQAPDQWPRGPVETLGDPWPPALASPAWPAYAGARAVALAAAALDGMEGGALQAAMTVEDNLPARALYRQMLDREGPRLLGWPVSAALARLRRRRP